MGEIKVVKKYETGNGVLITITHDLGGRESVNIRIDEGEDEGGVASITIPHEIWEKLVY